MPVGEWLVKNRPEVLSGLKLGRVSGEVDEPEALRNDQVRLGVPAGVVEPKHNDALASRPGLLCEQRQQRLEERLGHPVRYVPEGLARGRQHESCHIEPLVTVMAKRNGPLTLRRPDPAQDGLQAKAVLVGRPDLDWFVRVLGRFFGGSHGELFSKASLSSGVAACG